MSINLFIDSLLKESDKFKNLKDLFDCIRNHKDEIEGIKIFFDNNSKIFDVINNYFINNNNIDHNYYIEVNNRSKILISSNDININLIINILKICIENIRLNKKKIEAENIDNIIDFSSKISSFSTDENKILDYTLDFCNKTFNSENISFLIYNKDEALIRNSYNNNEIIGLGYLLKSKLGQALDQIFTHNKSILLNNLNLSNEIYNSLGQISVIFNKEKTILVPLYKEDLKIGILIINIDNLINNFNEISYILTNIGKIVSNNLYNIKKYNEISNNNSYLNNLIKTSRDGIISLDISGNINLWNEGAKNIFQYEEDEVKGKSLFNLFSSDTRLKVRSQWIEVLNGKSLNNMEGIAIKKDSTKFPVFYTLSLINDNNKLIGVSIIFRDLTERKKLEKDILESKSRLQAIFDGLNEIIVLFSLENNILMANKEAIKLANIPPKDLIGSDNYILIEEIKIKPLEIVKYSKKTFIIDKIFFESKEYNLKFIPVFDSIGNIISIILYAQELKD